MKKDKAMTKQNRKLEMVIERLTNAMKDGFTHVELEVETGYYGCHSAILKVTKNREETDQEYNERMQREQYYQDSRRREYERMKKRVWGRLRAVSRTFGGGLPPFENRQNQL